ncbi:MAG TPA: DUF397 domain-containing protein [Acidimicrobiales bacterium]
MAPSSGLKWRKSSYSGTGNRVEGAYDGGRVLVRNSTLPDGPVLQFTADEWRAFAQGVKAGEFDE